jgi:cytoskeleton protein RodZ
LRETREQLGLSIDAVATHLKLAPRQIRALEDEAYDQLPSRAFIRGFIRNYARLLKLDGDALLASMEQPPAAAPLLPPMPAGMGELPQARRAAAVWQVWAIPALLVIALAVGAYYEWDKSQRATNSVSGATKPVPARPVAGSTNAKEESTAPAVNPSATAAQNNAPPTQTPAPSSSAAPATAPAQPGPPASSASTMAAPVAGTARSRVPGIGEVSLSFRDLSWVEVRDQKGQVLLSQHNAAGSKQTVSGKPPLTVVIGNADQVKLIYNSKSVDLAPYIHQNVARLTLN